MQAVILAAGKGVRMQPLTLERPKPLVLIDNRPLLEHIIDALPSVVDEIILVVGYKAAMIQEHFGASYQGRRIRYVKQWMAAGTAHALSMAAPLLTSDRFFMLNADDLHGTAALERALSYPRALLAATHPEPSKFGVIELNPDHTLRSIIEKPLLPPTNLISTGAMILDTHIFDYEAPRHETGEYYMTDPLRAYVQDYSMMVIEQDFWVPVGCPEDIPIAEQRLRG